METETIPETTHAEQATADNLYRFSGYVHAGAGAAECEHGEDGHCQNTGHFHGWCRLPNQFERASLLEKSQAAKARKLRVLRDPESDARVILEGEIESLKLGDPANMIEEIVNEEFFANHMKATEEVAEESREAAEDVEGAVDEYLHIDDHKERLRALEEMEDADRSEEEYSSLRKLIQEHTDKVNAAREALELPEKQALEGKTVDELADIVRGRRIEKTAFHEQNTAYGKWQWYVCTFKPRDPSAGFPNERVWGSIDDFTREAGEIVRAVIDRMQALEADSNATLKGS